MIYHLNIDTTYWISYKSSIVPRMVLRPRPGRTIVFAASLDGRLVEFVNKLIIYIYRQQLTSSQSSPQRLATYSQL